MENKAVNRLPNISLGLSIGPLLLEIATLVCLFFESVERPHGDYGLLFMLWLAWAICSVLHLCCASAGMALSVYAVTQKIRRKASVTALVLSSLSLVWAVISICPLIDLNL